MKHVLDIASNVTIFAMGIIVGLVLAFWDDDKCLQQQAGYQAVVTTQTKMLQTQIDLLAKEKARAGLLQASHTALQEELAVMLASRVGKIDDVMEGPEAIAVLAKRLAPVEAAVKEVAKDNHEFIPAAFRAYWGQVLENSSVVGQVAGKFLTRGK